MKFFLKFGNDFDAIFGLGMPFFYLCTNFHEKIHPRLW